MFQLAAEHSEDPLDLLKPYADMYCFNTGTGILSSAKSSVSKMASQFSEGITVLALCIVSLRIVCRLLVVVLSDLASSSAFEYGFMSLIKNGISQTASESSVVKASSGIFLTTGRLSFCLGAVGPADCTAFFFRCVAGIRSSLNKSISSSDS